VLSGGKQLSWKGSLLNKYDPSAKMEKSGLRGEE